MSYAIKPTHVGLERDRCDGGLFAWALYALSFLRPRARRARSTLRPPGVALRAKKPCRRARTRLLGWKVRFIVWVRFSTKTAARFGAAFDTGGRLEESQA